MSNRTVHSIMHLAWAHVGNETYQAQMAVYVKPRGVFGRAYMAFIKPFRYALVYPDLMRLIDRAWRRQTEYSDEGEVVRRHAISAAACSPTGP